MTLTPNTTKMHDMPIYVALQLGATVTIDKNYWEGSAKLLISNMLCIGRRQLPADDQAKTQEREEDIRCSRPGLLSNFIDSKLVFFF